MAEYIALENRGLIAVSGADARSFLQGLVTVDVLKLAPGKPRYAALLSPQGKFLHDFFLLADGDRILIDAEQSRLADLSARLLRYRLRAQVAALPVEDISVFALLGDARGAPEGTILFTDPRYAPMGMRLYGPAGLCKAWLEKQGFAEAGVDAYERHRLKLGVPDGSRDLIADRSFIMECGFEQLHAVDFDKGCYVGQELTARTKYRANIRKQFYMVNADSPLPPFGTVVKQGEKDAGELRSVQGAAGLAMLYTDVVQQGEKLMADNVFLHAALPPWAEEKSSGEESASVV